MSVIEQLASKQNRRDEIPNQLLAKHLVQTRDTEGIAEISRHVWDRDTVIQKDCIKVLYEIGYLAPDLIAPYAKDFLKLLSSKHNRLVWGAMLALSTVATIQADFLFEYVAEIQQAIADGSVITVDNGMKVISTIAAARPEYAIQLFPYLTRHLRTCRAKEIPQHSETILAAVTAENKSQFIESLQGRMSELTPAQIARVKKVIRLAEAKNKE